MALSPCFLPAPATQCGRSIPRPHVQGTMRPLRRQQASWRASRQGVSPEVTGDTCERKDRHRAEGPGTRSLERETGFEPATSTLARLHSTTELFPLMPCLNDAGTITTVSKAVKKCGRSGGLWASPP